MTAGSLYQINNATHNNNNFLELNPQISFFKVVYRKYSLFACENIKFDNLSRTSLSYDNNVIIKCDIPRNGDLLKNLYLTFELPAIYSGKGESNNTTTNFQWVKNIGLNIFEHVSFRINDQDIDKLYSDYINIWKELTLTYDEKEQFNKSIGHIKEIYDPAGAKGQRKQLQVPEINMYPHITTSTTNKIQALNKNSTTWSNFINIEDVSENTTFPSILPKKIKVPLPFFFSNNTGMALPLIALQDSICSLEFQMRKVRDLYTIVETNNLANAFTYRIKPGNTDHHNLTNFTKNFSSYDFKFNIEGEFIFLGEQERTRFAIHDHEYLIEQSKLGTPSFIDIRANSTDTKVKLLAFNPIKYMTWVVKRDDYDKLNKWNNYTNWVDEDICPYSKETLDKNNSGVYIWNTNGYGDLYYNQDGSALKKKVFYNYNDRHGIGDNDDKHDKWFNITYLKKEILTNVRLEFDGKTRIDKNIEYFGKQQILQNFKRNAKDGIYVYSFSLDPLEFQPSGTCNFSDIYEPYMYFTKEDMGDFSTNITDGVGHNFKAFIYLINYNILVINSGNGALKFVG